MTRPGVEGHPLDICAEPKEEGDELTGRALPDVPSPARRLDEQVSTGGSPSAEHRQHLVPSPRGYAQHLHPPVALPGQRQVQARRTLLRDAGRGPSSPPYAEPVLTPRSFFRAAPEMAKWS